MTAKLQKLQRIFGSKTDWSAKVAEYEARLVAGEQKLEKLQGTRLEHALPAAEGDPAAKGELSRIVAEAAVVEREQGTIREALEQARALLAQQRQREADEAEQKRQAAFQRVAGELLEIDRRADELMANLAATLDERRAKLRELLAFGKPEAIHAIVSRGYPARVGKRILRPHFEIACAVRCDETLRELDARSLGLAARQERTEVVA